MSDLEFYGWTVALHHRTTRGEGARHTERVGVWLRRNADCLVLGISDDWIAVGFRPTAEQASELLDRFQDDLER